MVSSKVCPDLFYEVDMHIGKIKLSVRFPGCRSLKEKRSRLRGLRDRFGKTPVLAVCEVGGVDSHQFSEWVFLGCSMQRASIDKNFSQIESFVSTSLDLQVLEIEREWL